MFENTPTMEPVVEFPLYTAVAPRTHTARLVWITPDAEALVADIARVSNPANQSMSNTTGNSSYKVPSPAGLLRYLIRNHHWSPFEMASMCIEINTTRAISPQLLRHRSFSFQEFSQRYADSSLLVASNDEPSGFEIRRQDIKNRQNSIDDYPEERVIEFSSRVAELERQCKELYSEMITNGVAKECARGILPLNTPTRLYMSGTIRSWIHYVNLRSGNGTQREHADIANAVAGIMRAELPNITRVAFD